MPHSFLKLRREIQRKQYVVSLPVRVAASVRLRAFVRRCAAFLRGLVVPVPPGAVRFGSLVRRCVAFAGLGAAARVAALPGFARVYVKAARLACADSPRFLWILDGEVLHSRGGIPGLFTPESSVALPFDPYDKFSALLTSETGPDGEVLYVM